MKRLNIVLITLLAATTMMAQQENFEQANLLYADGNYAEAADLYETCLTDEQALSPKSAALVYYNLGNARFKQEDLSQAILAYERALRLYPTYKDAKYNLAFAQSHIVDNIADTHMFFLSSWARALRNLLSESTWLIISIVLFILCLAGALCFALGKELWLRKSAFHIAWIALLISVITGLNALSLHRRDLLREEAIITQGVVNAKSSPDKSGTDLFTIHEGTKVSITETLGEWCNIHVGNNVGWVKLAYLERI